MNDTFVTPLYAMKNAYESFGNGKSSFDKPVPEKFTDNLAEPD